MAFVVFRRVGFDTTRTAAEEDGLPHFTILTEFWLLELYHPILVSSGLNAVEDSRWEDCGIHWQSGPIN